MSREITFYVENSRDTAVTLLYPNGNEVWETGKTYEIRWNRTGSAQKVQIRVYYYFGNQFESGTGTIIAEETENDGSFNFTVPSDTSLTSASNFGAKTYSVKIYPLGGDGRLTGDGSDESDSSFTIIAPRAPISSITVLNPNVGEPLIDGVPIPISWVSVNAPTGSTVGISVRGIVNGVVSWGYGIGSSTNEANGTINWIPRVLRESGEIYKIQAELFAPGAVHWNSPILSEDLSDSAFTINLPLGTTRSLSVISPTSGIILQAGGSYPIAWETSGISENGKILLTYKQLGTSTELGGAEITTVSNSGNYTWTVPASTSPGQWRIEAFYLTEDRMYGAQAESAYFTITAPATPTPSLTVLSPNGGETWRRNATNVVRWSSQQFSSNAAIAIILTPYPVTGTEYLIASDVSNTGSYAWNTGVVGLVFGLGGTSLVPDGTYTIRVSGADDSAGTINPAPIRVTEVSSSTHRHLSS